jgi:putative Holliday junction resolvase
VAPADPPAATVLAFDFGSRRIGIAVGNTLLRVAQPLATIDRDRVDERFAAIAALIAQWQPAQLVVGVPVHSDGTPHAMTARARSFARKLGGRFRLPVAEVDERYTTLSAQEQLDAQGRRGSKARAERDQVAAQIILQSWFDDPARRAR